MKLDLQISGKYRDVLMRGGDVVKDAGWKSNTIVVEDCGRLLAALMKKDFKELAGIDYIAFGSGSKDGQDFKRKISEYFRKAGDLNNPMKPQTISAQEWVWAKKIDSSEIEYINQGADKKSNKLGIEVAVRENEPRPDTFVFKEFALLGLDKDDKKNLNIFLINYVNHGGITKTKEMTRTLTLNLTFLGEKV